VAIEQADLDPDQQALLENLLGKDYEVITADDRLYDYVWQRSGSGQDLAA
jgi:DNA-binding winged helix-turn-helix (wHTH) protein